MLSVHVGQCGVQLGGSFWDLAALDDFHSEMQSPLFDRRRNANHPRCVFIDSEPKVVNKIFASKRFDVHSRQVVYGQSGRANNWAMGYYGARSESDQLFQHGLEAIRHQLEMMDNLTSIVLMHSTSGGTGSGLGSRMLQAIREQYVPHHNPPHAFSYRPPPQPLPDTPRRI